MCEAESRGDEEEQVKGEEGLLSVSPGDTHTHKRVGVESINTSQLLGENSALYIFSAIVYFISHAITTITATRTEGKEISCRTQPPALQLGPSGGQKFG